MKKFEGKNFQMLKIRERGLFWLRRIHLDKSKLTLAELTSTIYRKYKEEPNLAAINFNEDKGEIVHIYKLWDRPPKYFTSDDDVKNWNMEKKLKLYLKIHLIQEDTDTQNGKRKKIFDPIFVIVILKSTKNQ